MTEPPEKVLTVLVIGGVAWLEIQHMDETGRVGETEAAIRVPGESLVRALRVLIEDSSGEV